MSKGSSLLKQRHTHTYIYTHIRMHALHTQLPNDCQYAEYNARKMHSTPRCGITSIKAVRRMLHHEKIFFFKNSSYAPLHNCIHIFVAFMILLYLFSYEFLISA